MSMGTPKGFVHQKPTLCWKCKNAVPDRDGEGGCSWSRKFHPVDGWIATPTKVTRIYKGEQEKIRKGPAYMESFLVHYCPEFKEG